MVVVHVRDIGDVGNVHHVDAAPVPGMEVIPGSNRQPADVAESETEAEAAMEAESKERYVRRRPHGVVAGVHRSRPPAPGTAIKEPAAVVIRRPAPGLIRDPSPAVVGLPYPLAGAVRRPARAD